MNADSRYDSLFQYYAECHGGDWKDLKAQVKAESGFDPMARSMAGAAGLAQFMPATFDEWASRLHIANATPYNPEHAIECQAAYMEHLRSRYGGDQTKALAAYNWGMGHVDNAEPEDYPDETKKYLARIESYRSALA
jgi:soluble lytic murein transglycosylase-like protein